MKTPVQELTEKIENLEITLSTTRSELASTKREVKTLQKLLIGAGQNNVSVGAQQASNESVQNPKNTESASLNTETRTDTGVRDNTGRPIYIGDTVTLLTTSKANRFRIKNLFRKGDIVEVYGFLSGYLYIKSIGDPFDKTTRLPKNVKKN